MQSHSFRLVLSNTNIVLLKIHKDNAVVIKCSIVTVGLRISFFFSLCFKCIQVIGILGTVNPGI